MSTPVLATPAGRDGWEAIHPSARVVFPEPAGAEISVSGHGSRKVFVNRGRATIG